MKKFSFLRYLVFVNVYEKFKERFSENQHLLERFKIPLQQLFEKIPENSNLRKIVELLQEDGEYKYYLSRNLIILAPENSFDHKNMIQGSEQNWVGGVISIFQNPVNIIFI